MPKDTSPKRGGFGRGPTSIGEKNECQRPTRHRRGWIVTSHIGWGGEQNTGNNFFEIFLIFIYLFIIIILFLVMENCGF